MKNPNQININGLIFTVAATLHFTPPSDGAHDEQSTDTKSLVVTIAQRDIVTYVFKGVTTDGTPRRPIRTETY